MKWERSLKTLVSTLYSPQHSPPMPYKSYEKPLIFIVALVLTSSLFALLGWLNSPKEGNGNIARKAAQLILNLVEPPPPPAPPPPQTPAIPPPKKIERQSADTPKPSLKLSPPTLPLPTEFAGGDIALNVESVSTPPSAGDAFIPALDVFDISEVDAPPKRLDDMKPEYPLWAKRKGIEGSVAVEFLLTDKGKIEDIKITESIPEKVFDSAVIESVKQWQYAPAARKGKPVYVRMKVNIQFELEE